MQRIAGASNHRKNLKAHHHRPEKKDWRARQYDGMKKANVAAADKQFVLERPITLKPGAISTLLMLSALGSIMAPAAAVMIPHQRRTAQDETDLRQLIRSKMTITASTDYCATQVVEKIAKMAETNSAIRDRVVKVLKTELVKITCTDTNRVLPDYVPRYKEIQVSLFLDEVAPLSRAFRNAENHFLHSNKECWTPNSDQALAPIFPVTKEKMAIYHAAMDAGDARILEFKDLLARFKLLETKDELKITEALDSGDKRLRAFNQLLFKFKFKDKMHLTTYEIDKLGRYINASRNCLMQSTTRETTRQSLEEMHWKGDQNFVFDVECDTYFGDFINSIHDAHGGYYVTRKYHHTFDAIANLVDDVKFVMEHEFSGDSDVRKLIAREELTVSVLSEEALQVFYPELQALMQAEEKLCMPQPEAANGPRI